MEWAFAYLISVMEGKVHTKSNLKPNYANANLCNKFLKIKALYMEYSLAFISVSCISVLYIVF